MKKQATGLVAILLSFISFPSVVYAWTPLGHMVVATIAYQQLKPEVREKVDNIVKYLHDQYPEITNFAWAAAWPDMIRGQKIETYTHWHYTDVSFSTDGSPLKDLRDTDNAAHVLANLITVTQNEKANPYERTRFLAFTAHIIGDLHQPLHTVSNITANFPNGDKGGNLAFVRYKNMRITLHKLWDDGVGTFDKTISTEEANCIANTIVAHYPPAYFAKRVDETDPEVWLKEGMANSKQYVYATPDDQIPSDQYLATGKQIAEQQVALAGYRLATILNTILA